MRPVVERWNIGNLSPADRVEQWGEVLAETHLPWTLDRAYEDRGRYRAWVERRRMGPLSIVDCGCDPCGGSRGAREIRATDAEWVTILINLRGRELLEQGGASVELRPGAGVAWQSTQPARFAVLTPLRKRSVLVPRAALRDVCTGVDLPGGLVLREEAPETRLLLSFLDKAVQTLPELDAVSQATAARVTLELLACALRPEQGCASSSRREALHARMCAYIERNLAESWLRPQTLAAASGVSLRTLQVVFAEREESAADYIRRRRLARCHADLSNPLDGASVTDVAFRWGFVDAAHFSRVFKRRYGVSPREVRAGADQTE